MYVAKGFELEHPWRKLLHGGFRERHNDHVEAASCYDDASHLRMRVLAARSDLSRKRRPLKSCS